MSSTPPVRQKSDPEISFQQTIRVFAKLLSYLSLFKARIFTKLGFITFEHVLRILLLPWPLKIIVDHVILGEPINADGSGFPDYMQPILFFLSDKTSQEIMSWILVVGIMMVILMGMTPNRGTGRNTTGRYTGAAAGSLGAASAELSQGHDTATQTENASNAAYSEMGGLLGILDFNIHMRLSQSLNHLLRSELAEHIKSLPMTTLDDQRIGDSVYRVIYDTTSASGIYGELTLGLYGGLLMVALTLYVMFTSFGSAPEVIIVGVLVGPLTFMFVIPFARLARNKSQASRLAGSETTSNIEEGMANVLAVQSMGGNKRESERFANASNESFRKFRAEVLVKLLFGHAGSLAFLTGQIIFFLVIAGYVIDGTFTAGDYFVLFYYFFVLSAVFYSFGFLYTDLQVAIAGLARVFNLLDLPGEKFSDGVAIPEIQHGIKMRSVTLTYPDGRVALKDVNFEAQLGKIVALVGPTGAGKTSLAYLIPSFLQPTSGNVTIDGVDVRDISVPSLRKQVAYVFQETQLFSDSIADNIRYGNRAAAIEDVHDAAKTAGAHDFIMALPEGYDTNLGTITSKLSVGQKQRISIARGLLKKSKILILDEPTSALDPETVKEVLVTIKELAAEGMTCILVTHEMGFAKELADHIYFTDNGVIVEHGPPNEFFNEAKDPRTKEFLSQIL